MHAGHEPAVRATDAARDAKDTSRIEAFSDGVFSIAITLLVLELKVPPEAQGARLGRELLALWPSFFGYVTSFATIGIMWINHHRLFSYIRRVDHGLLVVNLVLLFGVAVVPFTTALMAEHLGHRGGRVAALTYAGSFVFISLAFQIFLRHMVREHRHGSLLRMPHDGPQMREVKRRYRFGPLFYIAALAAAAWSPVVSVAMQAGFAAFFALPPHHSHET